MAKSPPPDQQPSGSEVPADARAAELRPADTSAARVTLPGDPVQTRRQKVAFRALLAGSWAATQTERPRFYLFLLLFVAAYSIDLLQPWVVGLILGTFVQNGFGEAAFRDTLFWIGVYTALRLATTILHHWARYVQNRVGYAARMHAQQTIFHTLIDFPLPWHVAHHSGESLSKMQRAVGAIESVIGTYIWQVVEGLVKVVFAGIAIFALDLAVAINVLVMSGLTIASMILFNRRLVEKVRDNNRFNDALNRLGIDYLGNIVTVKTLHAEEAARRHLAAMVPVGLARSQAFARFLELKWGTTGVGYAFVISSSLLIYFYGHQQSTVAFDIAQVYVLLNYLDRIFAAIGSFTGYYGGLVEAATAYEDATALFVERDRLTQQPAVPAARSTWTQLEFRQLVFRYPGSERAGLNGVTLQLRRGESIALIGHSGSGKSTLLKLLGGLMEPDSGTVRLDGRDDVPLAAIADQMLLIPQEPEILSDTARYNLTLGESFSAEALADALAVTRADLVIHRMPGGLDGELAQRGLNLSGGEKQRLALARGLLREASRPILLLDEPTSSLDPKTEREIYLGLLHRFRDRTLISSVHRLNLVPLFDRIVLMASGEIVEQGAFAELVGAGGAFSRIWEDYQRHQQQQVANTPPISMDMIV